MGWLGGDERWGGEGGGKGRGGGGSSSVALSTGGY